MSSFPINDALKEFEDLLRAVPDAYLQERVDDIEDLLMRVQRSWRREARRWALSTRRVAAAEDRADHDEEFDNRCEATFLLGGKEALFDYLYAEVGDKPSG